MGRRLNLSTPTVINTELKPLDESFYIQASGQLEQWYYDNTSQFAPDRSIVPLLLTPKISVYDSDSKISYTPSWYMTQWFVLEYDSTAGEYVERQITDSVDGNKDYVLSGNNLLVKKNVSYTRAVTVKCVATYTDPRDNGITSTVQGTLTLTCNRDATVVWPEVAITSPSGRSFNPLIDYKTVGGVETQASEFSFEGTITNSPDVSDSVTSPAKYEADGWGTEDVELGDGCAPILDVRYPDGALEEDQEISFRPTADGEKLGSKGFAFVERIKGNTVAWNQLQGTISSIIKEEKGVTFNISEDQKQIVAIVVGDGVIGTSSAYIPTNNILTAGHKYMFRGCPKGGGDNTYYAQNAYYSNYGIDDGSGALFQADESHLSFAFCVIIRVNTPVRTYIFTPQLIDLTLIYGEGNEPATPEEFEADYLRWFGKPLTYEPYDEGSLRPVLMTGIKTTGFNQWDEQNVRAGAWSSVGGIIDASDYATKAILSTSYIRICKNAKYYLHCRNSNMARWYVLEYDGEKKFIGRKTVLKGAIYTPSSTASYFRFSTENDYGYNTYQHDICINLCYDNTRNGEYEAYKGNEAQIDVTTVKGKLNGTGSLVTVFPDGMKSAGSVHDEIYMENGKVYAVKRVESMDLGSLAWSDPNIIVNYPVTHVFLKGVKKNTKNFISAKYSEGPFGKDKTIHGHGTAESIYISDSAIDGMTSSEVKAYLTGVMLYYELATPQVYELDPLQNPFIFEWFGIKDGNEVLADTLPWYKSGQHTSKLTVDAMFGENINVVLRAKNTIGVMSPSKSYASLTWRFPDVDTTVQSHNGSAVRSNTRDMLFSTIMNIKGNILEDSRKREHLMLNWKYRKSNSTNETDAGWGQTITIDGSKLRNVKGSSSTLASTLVFPYVYLLGAYEEVTDDNEAITDDGENVFDRPVD